MSTEVGVGVAVTLPDPILHVIVGREERRACQPLSHFKQSYDILSALFKISVLFSFLNPIRNNLDTPLLKYT